MYIIKILLLRYMPSNQIFRILSALFLIGLPIWTMISSFEEETLLDKINGKLPLLFIPFVFLQIYSIGIRIQKNGITELRYLCLIFILFEIIYIIIYLKNKEKVSKMLLIIILLTIISTIMPYINMFSISNLSQYNNLKIYKKKNEYTDEDRVKIYGAYYYLEHSVEGEKYIDNYLTEEEKNEIIEFNYDDNSEPNNTKNIYATKDFDYIEIEGYKKLYIIDAYSYNNDETLTIDEQFGNISFNTQSDDKIELDIALLINKYIQHEQNLDIFFKENNEIMIDNNRKVLLKKISIGYDDITNVVNWYSISGYLLER
jgi:hypothetical protein